MGDSFATLFAAQSAEQQKGHREVHVGEMIEAVVVAIDRDTIFVELDAKRQAMLDVAEMRAADGTLDVKVGDTVRARVGSVDPQSGAVRLVRSFGKSGDAAQIEQAHAAGVAVEGKVSGVNKGGLEIDLGKGLRGFCPTSQIATRGAAVEPSSLVGQLLRFMVTEIKDGGRNIVLSRRRALEAEAREEREAAIRSLEIGRVVRGTVTAVRDFGAFVDLGGVEGLIPGAARVTAGESVEVKVVDMKDDDKGHKRITLSLETSASPEGAPKKVAGPALSIGAVVEGRVVRIETYGVFVQVAGTEGRAGRGLIPVSELDVPRGTDLRKAFPEGKTLTAKILETGDGRLKLSVRGAKDAAERAEFEAHKDKASAPAALGTFGELLAKSGALGKKK
ncbi:MAG TPA: S1 RNA-binding domain-containing protein [Polyangiaceae bacterium]|jgi:small subunit ribosomal protein S1